MNEHIKEELEGQLERYRKLYNVTTSWELIPEQDDLYLKITFQAGQYRANRLERLDEISQSLESSQFIYLLCEYLIETLGFERRGGYE